MTRLAVIGLAVAALAACGNGRSGGTPAPLPDEDANTFPTTKVEPVTTSRARKLGYVGVISARQSLELSAKIDGELASVRARLGDSVAKGDELALIDDSLIQNDLDIAKRKASAARAAVRAARLEVAQTKQKLAIEVKSYRSGTSSAKDKMDAEHAHQRALAARARAQANAAQFAASVKHHTQQLEYAKITAPFAGTVSAVHLQTGATVTRGTRVVRIISAGNLWVKFAVPADDAGRLSEGGAVDVGVESLGVVIPGTIRQIAPELDPTTQMIITEAELNIPAKLQGRVQAGFVARVKLSGRGGATAKPGSETVRDAGPSKSAVPKSGQRDAGR